MAMLRRKVIIILLWLPALCSKFFLCVCHPVYACAVSMRVPVGFIPITVLISIDLLTVLVVVTPELLTNVVFFFLFHFLKGNQRGTLKGDDGKRTKSSFSSTPPCPQITAKFLTYYRDEPNYKLLPWSLIFFPKWLTTLVTHHMFYFPVMRHEPQFKREIGHP